MNPPPLDHDRSSLLAHSNQRPLSTQSPHSVVRLSGPFLKGSNVKTADTPYLTLPTVKDFIFKTGYARWNPEEEISESFEECLDRLVQMYIRRFPDLREQIIWARERVTEGLVLPALRSLQYGGSAIEQNHVRMYNTWGTHVDRPEVFGEAFFILLSGGGIGFSVQFQHVAALPVIPALQDEVIHKVQDSAQGWGQALTQLILGRYRGIRVILDTQELRPSGTQDPVSGDYLAGPIPLLQLQNQVHTLFDQATNRKLRPIECYDLFCYVANAVVAEHNGRSAMLALFSAEDTEMLEAKTGNWYETHPWRQRSNNSAVLLRGNADRQTYDRVFKYCREWGEPGIYWTNDLDACSNSCVEAGFYPVLTLNQNQANILGRQGGERVSGWQGCTLSEINGAALQNQEDFIVAAKAATIFNTLQATYTEIQDSLGWVSRWLCERDALIGVGITGMMDNPSITLNPDYQTKVAFAVAQTNRQIAEKLGIRAALRTTLVKPSGKSALLFGGVSAGIHPRHASKYFMRFSPKQYHPAYQSFKREYPHLILGKGSQERVTFAIEAPKGALVRDELSAIEFLKIAKSTLLNWVHPGSADEHSPISHNVSMTVSVHDDEWQEVSEFLWEHQDIFGGVALMSYFGDIKHPLSPFQKLMDHEDGEVWQDLFEKMGNNFSKTSFIKLEKKYKLQYEQEFNQA